MRPRCEKCGKRLYRIQKMFSQPVPAHCPSCGAEISLKQKSDLKDYETIICIIAFIIVVIILIIFVN
ncbi:MAG: hypothetical protein KGD72_08620 [Candidatus Lokiarchaeota archaeon]|nr:hypothetical protein [Candidatus Lokiarchaeota archaeon]